MSEQILAQHDQRSVDELVNAALTEPDEFLAWDAVCALHWRGTNEVLQSAKLLCRSDCPQERCLGADIIGQLGVPDRTYPQESVTLLFRMLDTEQDADVLQSIFVAFSHLDVPTVVAVAPRFAVHPDPDVRHAVVLSLTGNEDPKAIDLLITLTNDSDSHVRDWATFGLGTQLDLDTPEIRNALAARLDDMDDDARGEAMIGLARRKDQRAIRAIQKDLESGILDKPLDAAALIESPELFAALIELRGSPGILPQVLEDIIAACTPQ